jgi:hypothetical protein
MNERQQTTLLRHGGWTKQRRILQQKIEDKKKGRKMNQRRKRKSVSTWKDKSGSETWDEHSVRTRNDSSSQKTLSNWVGVVRVVVFNGVDSIEILELEHVCLNWPSKFF